MTPHAHAALGEVAAALFGLVALPLGEGAVPA
jgi:hypothetical protein